MSDRYASILQDEEGVSPNPMNKYDAIVFNQEGTEDEPGIHLTPSQQSELESSADAAWKAQPKTGFLGAFGEGLIAPMRATARGAGLATLSHDTLKQHLEGEYRKATHAPEMTGAGRAGEFIGGLAGNVLQALPVGRALGTPGLIAQFGSQGAYDEFLKAGMRALSEGKSLDEATDIGRQASLGGAEVGAVLGAIMPGVGPSTMRSVLGQAAKLGGVAGAGRLGENLLERTLGLKTPPMEGVVQEGAVMGLFPVGTHLAGLGLRALVPPPLPSEAPASPHAPLALPERTGPIITPSPPEPPSMTGIEEQLRSSPVVAPRELPDVAPRQLPERTGSIVTPSPEVEPTFTPPKTLAEVEELLRQTPSDPELTRQIDFDKARSELVALEQAQSESSPKPLTENQVRIIAPSLLEALTGKQVEKRTVPLPVEEAKPFEPTIESPEGAQNATQKGQIESGVPSERARTDALGKTPETGVGDSVRPTATKPASKTTTGQPRQEVLLKSEATKPKETAETKTLSSETGKGPMEPQRRKTLREIREQNELGGESGFVNIGVIADKIKELQDQIAIAYKNGKVRAAMTFHKDAADNSAARYANQVGNDTRNILFRSTGTPVKPTETAGGASIFTPWKDPNSLPKTALTHAVESFSEAPAGSPEAGVYGVPRLQKQLAKLNAWKPPNESFARWKQTMVDGLNYAINNWNRMQPAVRRYQNETRAQQANETAHGIDTLYRNGYVLHEQDLTPNSMFNFLTGRGGDVNAQFLKTRTHPTYVDSLMAGVIPKSLDSIALLKARVNAGQKRINNKAWVDGLRGITDQTSGKPILRNPNTETRPDGKTYPVPPDPDYELARLGYETYAIHKGYEDVFSDLTSPSRFTRSLGGRALMKTAGTTKHLVLAFDTFHLGRLALWSSIIQGKPVGYKKGLVLLDYSLPEIQDMARRGEIPQEYLADISENKRKLDLATDTGYNMTRIQDALWQDWVQKIPVTGAFNKWLFGQFQRGAMVESWLHEFDRQRRQNPTLPEKTVARNVSRELNHRFGNLQSQGIFRSKSMQDLARLLFLAPQWNEGLIRSEIGAVTGAGRTAWDAATKDKWAMNALTRSAGILFLAQFAANQLINYITRGHSTLENPEEGMDAKISAYVPDIVGEGPGLFISPVALPAETAHLIYKRFEKSKDFDEALGQYLRTRLGTVTRPLNMWWTKTDPFGRAIRPDELWGEILKSAYPVPIAGGALYQAGRQVATGERAEQFPGQFQKQTMASGGVRTETVPTQIQRISSLAKEWNTKRGVRVPAQFYQSDYGNLDRFLRVGNTRDALKELELIRQKRSDDQITKRFKQITEMKFTHSSSDNEARFYSQLTDEQKTAYVKARMERMQLARRFWLLWAKRSPRTAALQPE